MCAVSGVVSEWAGRSADLDLGVADELVGRDREVQRRGAFADAPGRVVLGAVARAEPAVILALIGEWDAAEVGANADQHQPLLVAGLDARLVGLRVLEIIDRHRADLVDLLLGAMADEDRLAAPEDLDDLPFGDRGEVDLDRRAGSDRRGIGIHLPDQGYQRGGGTDGADRAGGNIEKITPRRLGR